MHIAGTRRFGIAGAAGQFAVRDSLPVRDVAEKLPHLELEWRALGCEWNLECLQFPGKVCAQLANRFGERIGIFDPGWVGRRGMFALHESDLEQTGVVSNQQQRPDGTLDLGV
jgi:hypothetical protein